MTGRSRQLEGPSVAPAEGRGRTSEAGQGVAAVKERGGCTETLGPGEEETHGEWTHGPETGWGLVGKSPVTKEDKEREVSVMGVGQVQRMSGPCGGNAQRDTSFCGDSSTGGCRHSSDG